MTRRILPSIVVAAIAVIAATRAASATPTEASKAENAEGQRLFRAGHYLESIPSFERAYSIDPDPAYLFDIAQAYRLAKSCAKAVDYYDRFFREIPNPPNADKIHAYRDDSAACAKLQAPPPPPPKPEPVVAPVIQQSPPPPPAPESPADPGRTLRLAGIGGIAIGVVAAGIAIYFTAHVGTLQSQRNALCPPDNCTWTTDLATQATDLDNRGHSAQTSAVISYSIAGAALAGGVVMYALGRRHHGESPVAVVPHPGGAMVLAQLPF